MNELCQAFDVSISCYYYHLITANVAKKNLMILISHISIDSGNTHEKRLVHAELIKLGHVIVVHKTRTSMKKLNIKAIRPKKRHNYLSLGDEHKYAAHLLKCHFTPDPINTHEWVIGKVFCYYCH